MKNARGRLNPMDYPRFFRFVLNIWPPYLGAAIRVKRIAPDWRTIDVVMQSRWYNRNYVKTHFGGNLFSMTDPFFMLMLIRNLGHQYIVWDAGARIKFIKPVKEKVRARFVLDLSTVDSIKRTLTEGGKILEKFHVDITDYAGERVASVVKTVYIEKK